MTKQQGGGREGVVMRDSQEKNEEKKVTLQEEKRRQRLIEREEGGKNGETKRARWIASYCQKISNLHNLPRCFLSPRMLAELSSHSHFLFCPYNAIFQLQNNSDCTGLL